MRAFLGTRVLCSGSKEVPAHERVPMLRTEGVAGLAVHGGRFSIQPSGK
jgi:hypothetical protein